MKKEDVIEFFDRLAPGWDSDMIRSDEVIGEILDNAGVTAGKEVLDVACGTGVLIPDYLEREVAQVTGIDISEEMIKIARRKFAQEQVLFHVGSSLRRKFRQVWFIIPFLPPKYNRFRRYFSTRMQKSPVMTDRG